MQLIKLETEGFKKLNRFTANFTANFTAGLNVIVGDNAMGKTTLLQAIECALYGVTVVPGKKENVITWGQKNWKTVLHFRIFGADDYVLTRTKSTAKLVRYSYDAGEELIANGNTPVTKAIEELLDLNAKDYNLFMQSKQGETSGVLTFGAAALNRKVEEFAGISLIDRVQGLAQEEHRTCKAQAEALEVSKEEMDAAEEEVDAYLEEATNAEGALKAAQEAFDKLPEPGEEPIPSVNPDALQKRRDAIAKLRVLVERAEQEQKHAKENYEAAQQFFDKLEKPALVDTLEEKRKELAKEIRAESEMAKALYQQAAEQRALTQQLAKAQIALEPTLPEDEIGEDLADMVERQAEAHEQRDLAKSNVIELNQKIKQLKSLSDDATCPTCGTQLTEHDPERLAAEIEELIEKREAQARQQEERIAVCKNLDNAVAKLEKDLEFRQAAEKEVDRLQALVDEKSTIEDLEFERTKTEQIHEKLLAEQAELDHLIEENECLSQAYRKAEREAKVRRQYYDDAQAVAEGDAAELGEALAEGEPTEEEIAEARQALADYERRLHELRSRRSDAKHLVERADDAFKQAQKDYERAMATVGDLRKRRDKAVAARQDADKAARLSRFLRERRAGYLQEVWDAVLGAATRQVTMASKGMITRLVFDDGEFLYEEEGVLAPVTSASGAQKAHIGVAIRIGLARALYGSNALLIFDEPTESMSEHHANGLSASLAGAAAQCLLITHREQDQDLAANVIELAA